jgi:high frequency lysogenization protein
MSSFYDKTKALAGVFQAVTLVNDLATTGQVDKHDFETSIRSIFETDPDNVNEVYGQIEYLRTGLNTLTEQLGNEKNQRNLNVARYVIALLHLQGKLSKDKILLQKLSDGIDRAKRQTEHFHITHENVIANLADVYRQTVSQIAPKIMVAGESGFLENPATANQIRALLLAGMRSAVLWSQMGGSRLQILFQRKRILQTADEILQKEIKKKLH